MNINIETINALITVIGTFIATLLITRYTMRRNIPLGKLEISYNRIYYPILTLLDNDANQEDLVNDLELRIKKYKKYFNLTTLRIYSDLQSTIKNKKSTKRIYKKLENDIYDTCYYLRGKLGYLNPGYYKAFLSLSFDKKLVVLALLDLLIIYILCFISFFPYDGIMELTSAFVVAFFIILLAIICLQIIVFAWGKMCCFIKTLKEYYSL